MSMIRCAACGSNNVATEKRKEGYNVKKGILGQVLFGLGGATMGINGKEQLYYHCATCGHTINHTLDYNLALEIDKAIENRDIQKIEKLRIKYPNIEEIETTKNNFFAGFDSEDEEEIKGILKEKIKEYLERKLYVERNDITKYIVDSFLGIGGWSNQKLSAVTYSVLSILVNDGFLIHKYIEEDGENKNYYRLPKNQDEALKIRQEKENLKLGHNIKRLIQKDILANYDGKYNEFLERYKKEEKEENKDKILEELAQKFCEKWILIEDYNKCKSIYYTYKEKYNDENLYNDFDNYIAKWLIKLLQEREKLRWTDDTEMASINMKYNKLKQSIQEKNSEKIEEYKKDIEKLIENMASIGDIKFEVENEKRRLQIFMLLIEGKLSISQICEKLDLSKQAILGLTKKLERNGLIEITRIEKDTYLDGYFFEIK